MKSVLDEEAGSRLDETLLALFRLKNWGCLAVQQCAMKRLAVKLKHFFDFMLTHSSNLLNEEYVFGKVLFVLAEIIRQEESANPPGATEVVMLAGKGRGRL